MKSPHNNKKRVVHKNDIIHSVNILNNPDSSGIEKPKESNIRPKNPLKRKSQPVIFYFVLLSIPILFFVLLEISLRLLSYGTDNRQWVHVNNEIMYINPGIAHRYFYNTKEIPSTIQDVFDIEKKSNAFRVFVFGESSAAGYPYMPLGAFSRYLQKRLELVYPDSKIEVVNVALTAVNSYTIRDLFPGVLEQKPDLILIYTGHNEYYGALGVGSTESLGSSRFLVNTALYFNRFKTLELVRNIIKGIIKTFRHDSGISKGTLMSRIVKDQYIPYKSGKYEAGLGQFEGNLKDILEMAKEKNVPVILGTVASNLKDQPPFISLKEGNLPSAAEVFKQAQVLLKQNNFQDASFLFKKAKDLDALRFRAPEEVNKIILKLGKEFGAGTIDIDSVFNAVSPNGITGSNLMTDHLHPTLEGYKLIGKLFYEKMEQLNILPSTQKFISNDRSQDSAALVNFNFSKLDSTIADFRIKYLKNDWPFIERNKVKQPRDLFRVYNIIDTTAVEVVDGTLEWEKAQRRIAGWYLHNNDIKNFENQMNVLISQYPFYIELYDFTIKELLQLKKFDDAYGLLYRRFKNKPDAFSAKWLGIIDLSNGHTDNALKYLQESLKYDNNDTQVLYNLSGAYLYKKQYDKALSTINLCLSYDPNYAGAKQIQGQLNAIVHK